MSAAWLGALAAAALLLARRSRAGAVCSMVGLLLAAAPAAPALAAGATPMVNGVIVQLRDAPTHAELMRERAQTHRQRPRSRRASSDAWRDLMAALPAMRVAERRAVGASAQLLRFERPMSAQQAQAFAAQLAQRPDVAWAAPNTRERRLAGHTAGQCAAGRSALQRPVVASTAGHRQQRRAQLPRRMDVGDDGRCELAGGRARQRHRAHPDLAGKVIAGYDMVSDPAFSNDRDGRDADPTDPGDWVDAADLQLQDYKDFNCKAEPSSWHGTVIAGMLAANVNNGRAAPR